MTKFDPDAAKRRMETRAASKEVEGAPTPTILDHAAEMRKKVPVSAIRRSPFQRRASIDPNHVADLAASISEVGLNTPLLLREVSDGFELIAGENRWEAVKLLKWDSVDAKVQLMTDEEAAKRLTTDNLARKDLSDWEIYKHMRMLKDAGYVTLDEQMAAIINRSRPVVTKLWAFAIIPESVHDLLDDRRDLLGVDAVDKLRKSEFHATHPELFETALRRLHAGSIKTQNALIPWINEQISAGKKDAENLLNRELVFGSRKIKLVGGRGRVSVAGKGLNLEAFERLIEQNLKELFGA